MTEADEAEQKAHVDCIGLLEEAVALLELCHGTCDLHYGLAYARGTGDYDDPRSVHDEVGDFLDRISPSRVAAEREGI